MSLCEMDPRIRRISCNVAQTLDLPPVKFSRSELEFAVRIAIACLLSIGFATAAEPLDGLDEYVAKCLKAHGVPGIGVAVVQDGKVILCRGYGTKTTGSEAPVTKDTLFAIGSVSKSFTVAMIAMLIDEGKMNWDDRLRNHLPNFRTYQDALNDEITIRDCLGHRCGLARHELVWYGSPFKRNEILNRVRLLKPDAPIRTQFIYNNIMYLAAGEAAAKAAGKSWDEFIVERIFKPLGMTSANTSITKFKVQGDIATPHTKVKGVPTAVAWRNADNMGPAGSINASAADMAEYLKFQLRKGKVGDKILIERDTFLEMHKPLTFLSKGQIELIPESKFRSYAMGWMVQDFRGTIYVEHGGNIDGMSASCAFLPEKKMGVVVLANLNGSLLPQTLGIDILDRLLGQENQEIAFQFSSLSFLNEWGLQTATEPDATKRIKDTKPSFKLEKYVGRYQDDIHPSLLVREKDGKLSVDFNTFEMDLEHWHYDTFLGTDKTHILAKTLMTFDQSSDGDVEAIRFKPLITKEFRFKKVSDRPKR